MSEPNNDSDLANQLNNLYLENENLKSENESLKVKCNEAEDRLKNLAEDNDVDIFEMEPVKGVIQRYKQQIAELKTKLKSKTTPQNNINTVQPLQEQIKQLLKMNETYANGNEQKSAQIATLLEEKQKLEEEITALKEVNAKPEHSNEGMFTSLSSSSTPAPYIQSPEDDHYTVLSPPSGSESDETFLKFSNETIVNTLINPPHDHTEAFLYEYQTAKAKVQELEETNSNLEKQIKNLQEMLNNEHMNPLHNNYQNNDEITKVNNYNDTLQHYLLQERESAKKLRKENDELLQKIFDLEQKPNDTDVFQEQIKAFQEDFDTERQEKVSVLRQKSTLQTENQSMKDQIGQMHVDMQRMQSDLDRYRAQERGGRHPYYPGPQGPPFQTSVPYQRPPPGNIPPEHGRHGNYTFESTGDMRYGPGPQNYNNPSGHRGNTP